MAIFLSFLGVFGFNLSVQAKILDNFPYINLFDKAINSSEGQGGPPNNLSNSLSLSFLKLGTILKFLNFDSNQKVLGGIDDADADNQSNLNNENQNDSDELNNNKKFIYIVKEGDTLVKIAQEFGISVNTILWANKIKNPRLIKPGDELIILPVDGVVYTVKNGDTLWSIAKKFRGDVEEIIAFNNLPSNGDIFPGQEIVIPDGRLPQISSSSSQFFNNEFQSLRSQISNNLNWVWVADNYFIMPTEGRNWGKKHANNGVDISNNCGTPVRAAADGEVIYVSFTPSTWRYANGGYGNNIRILHPNGTITLYAHLLYGSALVKVGDIVNQSQVIAFMGGKPGRAGAGNTTGCHLHFEVRGGKNPFVWR